jgi:hypothetical protein
MKIDIDKHYDIGIIMIAVVAGHLRKKQLKLTHEEYRGLVKKIALLERLEL